MPAVSDSSPLILYAAIDRLDLLHEVYGDVVVPPAVWEEIVVEGAGRVGSGGGSGPAWIGRRLLPVPIPGESPIRGLDRGEAEAIALAQSYSPTVSVILDDLRARRVAEDIGLRVTGSVGVLLAAKR